MSGCSPQLNITSTNQENFITAAKPKPQFMGLWIDSLCSGSISYIQLFLKVHNKSPVAFLKHFNLLKELIHQVTFIIYQCV